MGRIAISIFIFYSLFKDISLFIKDVILIAKLYVIDEKRILTQLLF